MYGASMLKKQFIVNSPTSKDYVIPPMLNQTNSFEKFLDKDVDRLEILKNFKDLNRIMVSSYLGIKKTKDKFKNTNLPYNEKLKMDKEL